MAQEPAVGTRSHDCAGVSRAVGWVDRLAARRRRADSGRAVSCASSRTGPARIRSSCAENNAWHPGSCVRDPRTCRRGTASQKTRPTGSWAASAPSGSRPPTRWSTRAPATSCSPAGMRPEADDSAALEALRQRAKVVVLASDVANEADIGGRPRPSPRAHAAPEGRHPRWRRCSRTRCSPTSPGSSSAVY